MKTSDIERLVRDNVRKLKPYSSARDEFQGSASVYLDANENPNNTSYNRYPDPHQIALKKKIAAVKKVDADHIFLGNGSDEPIDLLIRAFCEPGRDNVLIPEPTYGMYSISAAINNVEIRKVTLTPSFDVDLNATETAWDERTKIIFLCSPNNPSGNLLSQAKIGRLLSVFPGLVVVDEAYIDFTDAESFLTSLPAYPNLVVLQTFSKAWGLAGIRLGMCFASPLIISVLNKIKPPYNISALTQQVASEALDRESLKNVWVTGIIRERKALSSRLSDIPLVKKIHASDANFMLVEVAEAKKVYAALVDRGIILRDRSNVILCDNCLRITVGTPEENNMLIESLRQL